MNRQFKEAIGYKRDIKIYHKKSTFGEQDNCRINFMNAQFTHDLIKLGITLDKSNTGVFPKISKELYPHMIRGYLDGNGTIRIQGNKNKASAEGSKARSRSGSPCSASGSA